VHAEGLGIDIVHDKEFLFLFHTEDIDQTEIISTVVTWLELGERLQWFAAVVCWMRCCA
jgi:hypothetical protein